MARFAKFMALSGSLALLFGSAGSRGQVPITPATPGTRSAAKRLRPPDDGWVRHTAATMQVPPPTPAPLPVRLPPSPSPSPTKGAASAPAPVQGIEGGSPPTPLPIYEGKKTQLPPAKLEAGDAPLPINLATALKLADARPLVIAAAQASAWVAEAELQHAKVLWVPELSIAAVYIRHDGIGPDVNRGRTRDFNPNSQALPISQSINYFYGGGGFNFVFPLTDAIFKPLAAQQTLRSKQWDIQSAKNDALLQTATAYFNVHRRRGMYAGALDAVNRGRELVKRVELLAEDLVTRAEVNRSKRALADLEQAATSAREEWRVASADLTQVLRLDPRVVVVPQEHDHLRITLVDPAKSLDELIPIGLTSRPELASQQRLVQAALVRIRQEKLRPLTPSIILTGFQTPGNMRMQFGMFGTGNGRHFNNWSFRDDISCQLAWQLDGMGLGNLAKIKTQRSIQSRALVQLFSIQDSVAAEITQTQANMQSAAARVLQAERSLREALITYDKNYEGLRQTKRFRNFLLQVYRPQEAVVALEDLKRSYDEYFMTVADYNQAQFQMYHALGYPAQGISTNSPPGDLMPVDTSRPGYMPGVGSGPPPATR